jgi:hypothetical protein
MEVAIPARPSLVPKCCLHKPSGRAYVRIRGKVVYTGDYGSDESKQRYGRLVVGYLDYAQGHDQKHGHPTRSLDNIKRAIKVVKDLYGREPVATFSPLYVNVGRKAWRSR